MTELGIQLSCPIPVITPRWGFAQTFVISTAVELSLFTHIANGCTIVERVAESAGCDERATRMLLDAVVSLDLLKKDADGSYALTLEAEAYLVEGSPFYLGGMMGRVEDVIKSWANLTECVKTGKPVLAVEGREHGAEFFKQVVISLMPVHHPGALAAADALGIGSTWMGVRALDVGAGSGIWGIAVAQRDPTAHVTAFDWEPVLEVTKECVEQFGVAAQFDFRPGDMREDDFAPEQFDLVLLGHVCHSEGEEHSRALLAKAFVCLKPGGKLVIAEYVPDDNRAGPIMPLIFAVNMLVFTAAGDTFTFAEYAKWLKETGFTAVESIEAPAPSPLIVATR